MHFYYFKQCLHKSPSSSISYLHLHFLLSVISAIEASVATDWILSTLEQRDKLTSVFYLFSDSTKYTFKVSIYCNITSAFPVASNTVPSTPPVTSTKPSGSLNYIDKLGLLYYK